MHLKYLAFTTSSQFKDVAQTLLPLSAQFYGAAFTSSLHGLEALSEEACYVIALDDARDRVVKHLCWPGHRYSVRMLVQSTELQLLYVQPGLKML